MKSPQHCGQTRRSLLTTQTAGIVSAFAAAGMDIAAPGQMHAQTEMTPDAALQALMEGNKRFMEGRLRGHLEDLEILKQKTIEKQEPFAAVLSCADSRVPIEIIFDQSIGHVFVTRVAGNLVTPEIIGSLEYGAIVLGTKAILILGHANCGAVKAAMENKPVPGQISTLYRHIQPAVERAKSNLEAAIKANAMIQRDLLRKSSPVIAELLKENKIKVVAGFYSLATGSVTLLES